MSFLKGIFCEPDGTPSFSRCACGVLLVFAVVWVSWVIIVKYAIPDLLGIAALFGSLYGMNQLSKIVKPDKKDEDDKNGDGKA